PQLSAGATGKPGGVTPALPSAAGPPGTYAVPGRYLHTGPRSARPSGYAASPEDPASCAGMRTGTSREGVCAHPLAHARRTCSAASPPGSGSPGHGMQNVPTRPRIVMIRSLVLIATPPCRYCATMEGARLTG